MSFLKSCVRRLTRRFTFRFAIRLLFALVLFISVPARAQSDGKLIIIVVKKIEVVEDFTRIADLRIPNLSPNILDGVDLSQEGVIRAVLEAADVDPASIVLTNSDVLSQTTFEVDSTFEVAGLEDAEVIGDPVNDPLGLVVVKGTVTVTLTETTTERRHIIRTIIITGLLRVRCDLSVEPSEHDFGEVEVGTFVDHAFVLANVDTATENCIGSVRLRGDREFSILAGGRFDIPPGGSHETIVRFDCRREKSSELTSTMTIRSNEPGGAMRVPVAGICVQPDPDIAADRELVHLGNLRVGEQRDETFILRNEGGADLRVINARLGGSNGAEFELPGLSVPFTLAPDEEKEITVRFSPQSIEEKSGRVIFTSNDPDETLFTVRFRGRGLDPGRPILPEISIDFDRPDFGEVELGAQLQEIVTIINDGIADLIVDAISILGDHFTDWLFCGDESLGGPFIIAPGDSQKVEICFRPIQIGIRRAILQIISNDPNRPLLAFALIGSGIEVGRDTTLTFADNARAVFSGVTSDAYLDERKSTFNTGATDIIRVGNNGAAGNRPYRSVIRFDFLDGLTATGVTRPRQILDAFIDFSVHSSEGTSAAGLNIDIFSLNRNWREGETDYAPAAPGEVTWVTAAPGDDWAVPGAGGSESDRNTVPDDTQSIAAPGQVRFNVMASVQAIVESGQNFGWLLQAQDETMDKYLRLFSSEHAKEALRPVLTIIARIRATDRGTGGAAFSQTQIAGDAAGAKAQDSSSFLADGERGADPQLEIPTEFALEQNYPNPFNPETTIRYSLPTAATVTIAIFDLTGSEVRALLDREARPPGSFSVAWDGRDRFGRLSASGTYFYRILIQPQNDGLKPFVKIRSMTLVK